VAIGAFLIAAWEQDCHLFLKRALLNEQLGGSPADYGDRLFDKFARPAD
jgi:hypothetical protein